MIVYIDIVVCDLHNPSNNKNSMNIINYIFGKHKIMDTNRISESSVAHPIERSHEIINIDSCCGCPGCYNCKDLRGLDGCVCPRGVKIADPYG